MSIVVYWLAEEAGVRTARHEAFAATQLTEALARCEVLRRSGARHVSLSSEPAECVSPPGVSAVEGGLTPDGERYEWSKAHRAGAPRRRGRRPPRRAMRPQAVAVRR